MSVAVRMRTTSAGPEGVVRAGAVVRVSSKEAAALVAGGYADLAPEEHATLIATRDAAAPPAPAQDLPKDPPAPSGPMALSGPPQALVTSAPAPAATTAIPDADLPAAAGSAVDAGDAPQASERVVAGDAGDDSWTSDAPQALASAAAAEGRRGKRSAG